MGRAKLSLPPLSILGGGGARGPRLLRLWEVTGHLFLAGGGGVGTAHLYLVLHVSLDV